MSQLEKEFGKIYDKSVDKIYRFIYLKVNSQEIAEDLTSETFTRGWEAFQKQASKIDNPQAFLYQIARNLVTDQYRQKAQAQFVSMESVPQAQSREKSLEEIAMLTSDVGRIKAALAKVNDNYREIIVWYYLDEFTVPEIAKILNKSEEAVRVVIHRALKALRAELQ
ncbi:MAG: sigma-70 family RNA polymerase sigma factor [Candidatus Nealsonbacteria bacterium]|nr:sigma-70 family RNA polymerase sigma factor [Candidatus Nealsonbacteria bacterium]